MKSVFQISKQILSFNINCLLGVIFGISISSVLAQENAQPEADIGSKPRDKGNHVIEEIIVTAQKRGQGE